MSTDGPDSSVHTASDPRDSDTGVRVVGPDDQFECSVCADVVGRFGVHYHGGNQYCPSCWDRIEPHKDKAECSRCSDEFMKDVYETNLVTWEDGKKIRKPDICDSCESEVFSDD